MYTVCIIYIYCIFYIHMVIQWFIIWYVCMIFSCDMRCSWNLDAGFQFAAWKGSGCTWIYCIVVSNQKSVSQAWTYRMILWKQLQYELPGAPRPTDYGSLVAIVTGLSFPYQSTGDNLSPGCPGSGCVPSPRFFQSLGNQAVRRSAAIISAICGYSNWSSSIMFTYVLNKPC